MRDILIVVPDLTRKAHLNRILPILLSALDRQDEEIEILVATGLHRPLTKEELARLLGRDIVNRIRVYNHSLRPSDLVRLGRTRLGLPVVLNRRLFEATHIITVGLVEPHLYAGFSGGPKTLAIGLAGEKTINATHSKRFMDDPNVKLGKVAGNPFWETLNEIASRIPVRFGINIVNDRGGNLSRIFWGEPGCAFQEAVEFAGRSLTISLSEQHDVLICDVGENKGINLYQASRAINYVLNVSRPVLRKGGWLIIEVALKEGVGSGLAERRFEKAMRGRFFNRGGFLAGEHRAYLVLKALGVVNVAFVGIRAPSITKGMPFKAFSTTDEALNFIRRSRLNGKSFLKIYRLRNALNAILSLK